MSSCRIQIRVLPNAKHSGWAGMWNGTHYKVALRAPAVDGKANEALIEFLAETFQISKRQISIVQGQTNRCKVIDIQGKTLQELSLPPNTI